MTEQNETTPFDYLKSDINGISLADAYKQGKRDGTRMVAEEIAKHNVISIFKKKKYDNLGLLLTAEYWQAFKNKHLKGVKNERTLQTRRVRSSGRLRSMCR